MRGGTHEGRKEVTGIKIYYLDLREYKMFGEVILEPPSLSFLVLLQHTQMRSYILCVPSRGFMKLIDEYQLTSSWLWMKQLDCLMLG